jgi:hypothetical protein
MSQQLASIQKYNVHIYRNKNLVYLATLKAASTFYSTVVLANGWDTIAFGDIDWHHDHVFGFIIDPFTKYIKALAEDYFNEEIETIVNGSEDWIADPEFQKLLPAILSRHKEQCLILTHHSLPLSITLDDYANLVDWIPIDIGVSSVDLFTKLCKQYTITIDYSSENIDIHTSMQNKISVFNDLKEKFGQGNYISDIVLAKDIDLYQNVKSKFNPHEETWDKISWLRKQK